MYVSGLDRLVEAVEVAERASAARTAQASTRSAAAPQDVSKQRAGFVCPVAACRKIFSKKYNQITHMRLHDGTRPFACSLCAKTFMWKSSLKSHARFHAKLAASAAAVGASGGPVTPLAKKPRRVAPKRKLAAAVITPHQVPAQFVLPALKPEKP